MTLSIGSLEIRIMPSKGKSISRIRKMAPATESVDAIKATVAVVLDGASRLKLRKMSSPINRKDVRTRNAELFRTHCSLRCLCAS